jgi:hypothetical protein
MKIFEWTQGIFAIIEAEEKVDIMRLMLAHYRDLFRDAQSYGFDAAKWTNSVVLSALEKGKFTWAPLGWRTSVVPLSTRAHRCAKVPQYRSLHRETIVSLDSFK